jgi:hypothetical protein
LAGASFAQAQAIVADHTRTNLASLSDAVVANAAALRVHLRRASVGGNISGGLDTLRSQNARYDRSKWVFGDRGNPGWQAKVDDFVTFTTANQASYDVLSMKFCYIDPDASFTYYRDHLLALEVAHPTKRIVWWTIPIETSGNTARQLFNDQVRAYALANGKALFDIADIETYNTANQKLTDSSGRELLRAEWTSDGGHLNSAGSVRVASAWWWLMAQIATPVGPSLAVTAISPVSGSVDGGTTVTITGTAFAAGATVTIGGVAATSVTVVSSTKITAVTPAHALGSVDVTVTIPGPQSVTLPASYYYAPDSTAGSFHSVAPCRLVDTRSTNGPVLAVGERRVLSVGGNCGVPANADAVALNATVTGPTAAGYLRLTPGNGLSESSALNFSAGKTRANNSVVQLATDGTGTVAATNSSNGTVHLILDVTGYFQ